MQKTNYSQFLRVVFFGLFVLVLLVGIFRFFDPDEIEHTHAAWLIKENKIPYKDFFEHHNPLLWYIMAPFIALTNESTQMLLVFRVMMFIMIIAIFYFVMKICKEITDSKEFYYTTGILLLTNLAFIHKAIEIRPDVPQALTGIIAIWFIIKYLKNQKTKHAIFSGFFLAISLIFLQKTLLTILAIALAYLLLIIIGKAKIQTKHLLAFSIAFIIPNTLFLLFLYSQGALRDYIWSSWMLNMNYINSFSALINLHFIPKNIFLWLLILFGGFTLIKQKEKNQIIVFLYALFCALLILNSIIPKTPFIQYFITAMALMPILATYFLVKLLADFKITETYKAIFIFLLIAYPVGNIIFSPIKNNNLTHLEALEYIKNNTEKKDQYYGSVTLNLFTDNIDYIWFDNTGWFDIRNRNDPYKADKCKVIQEKKPKVVYFTINIGKVCNLESLDYEKKIIMDEFYLRKDN